MADERTITTIFKADISQFSSSTQDLNRYVKQVNSEFANATAHLSRWNDNTEGLTAKLNQLNGVLQAEKKKLEGLEAQYAELVAQGKENTKEAQDLATAINNQGAKVKKTEKDIAFYTSSLKELEEAGVDTKEELDKVNKELDEQKQKAKDLGGGLLKGLAVGIAGIGVACVGALKGLSSLVENTKELRTQMGQLETAFEEQGHSIANAEKTFNDLVSVVGDTGKATEASMHLAQFAQSEKELEELTNALTGAYARFGDSLPIENIAEGASTTLTLGQANAGMVDAIEFAGGSVEDFNAKLQSLTTEEEKRQFILETLNGIYGETGQAYKANNEEVIKANEAQHQYNTAMAELGTKVAPIMAEFKLVMVDLLQSILAKFNEVDIKGLIQGIADVLKTSINWLIDNKDLLLSIILGVGTAFLTWKVATMIQGVVKAIQAMKLATEGMTIAQRIFNGVLKANPIGLIATAIGVLIGAITYLWNTSEGFRNFFTKMWEGIVGVVKGAINGIIGFINLLIGAINAVGDGLGFISGGALHFEIGKIPYLAKGGVVDKPTLAMVGEAGKEAVMPLERNTGWINELADKLASKMTPNNATTNNFNYTFERMETSKHALHKAQIETKRLLKGV